MQIEKTNKKNKIELEKLNILCWSIETIKVKGVKYKREKTTLFEFMAKGNFCVHITVLFHSVCVNINRKQKKEKTENRLKMNILCVLRVICIVDVI